ncbi:MAG: hypothetical protein ACI4SS_02860 [Clostridia bacterium]
MKDIFWQYFTETGDIELYLQYKKHCRERKSDKAEVKPDGFRNDKNEGSDSADGEQRG